MSELAHVSKLRRDDGGASPFVRLSYRQIGLYVAIADVALIFCASIFGDLAYSYLLGNAPDAEMSSGVGIVACAIFWLVARSWGLYDLPTLLASQQRISPVLMSWAMVFLALPLLLFLLKVGNGVSRGSMMAFASLGLALLVGFRLLASSISSGLDGEGLDRWLPCGDRRRSR